MAHWMGKGWARKALQNSKKRAKERGLHHTITREDLEIMLIENECRCVLTGKDFSDEIDHISNRKPWIPSIDRIDNGKGYTVDNVRLVCNAVNIAMNDFGETVLRDIAYGLTTYGRLS